MAERLKTTVAAFADFLARPENANATYELINGEIVKKVVTEEHGIYVLNIGAEIRAYLKQNRIGHVTTEAQHSVDAYNNRRPDVSFRRTTGPAVRQGAIPQMPDLAVEVKSPSQSYDLLREKARYYIANGTQLVWLVWPASQTVEVHRPNTEPETLTVDDTLDGGDVLPGFELPITVIFDV